MTSSKYALAALEYIKSHQLHLERRGVQENQLPGLLELRYCDQSYRLCCGALNDRGVELRLTAYEIHMRALLHYELVSFLERIAP